MAEVSGDMKSFKRFQGGKFKSANEIVEVVPGKVGKMCQTLHSEKQNSSLVERKRLSQLREK